MDLRVLLFLSISRLNNWKVRWTGISPNLVGNFPATCSYQDKNPCIWKYCVDFNESHCQWSLVICCKSRPNGARKHRGFKRKCVINWQNNNILKSHPYIPRYASAPRPLSLKDHWLGHVPLIQPLEAEGLRNYDCQAQNGDMIALMKIQDATDKTKTKPDDKGL